MRSGLTTVGHKAGCCSLCWGVLKWSTNTIAVLLSRAFDNIPELPIVSLAEIESYESRRFRLETPNV